MITMRAMTNEPGEHLADINRKIKLGKELLNKMNAEFDSGGVPIARMRHLADESLKLAHRLDELNRMAKTVNRNLVRPNKKTHLN